jgi:transposase InsO family protein
MQTRAENLLNPKRYYLSEQARKRLKWMYLIYYETEGNISQAAARIGISREWLNKLKSSFEKSGRNPRVLEPRSRAPRRTNNRHRISDEVEDAILAIRAEYGWGKENISTVLNRDYGLQASPSTVNRYLHKHKKICPKISERNQKAWLEKKMREELGKIKVTIKYRPPSKLKDYQPGALIEKDMKLVPTTHKIPVNSSKFHIKDHFNYQHTFLDTFTRIRGLELTEEPDSLEAQLAYTQIKKRFPFPIASVNTDSGGENGKNFKQQLANDEVIHFYSRTGTPTDNPRVERSHLTDDNEFWKRGHNYHKFNEQKEALSKWEYIYNYIRPNQALGNLTPIQFYQLWQENPARAYRIKDKYKQYLEKQRKRQASARRLKSKEQIEKLMHYIDAKLMPKTAKKIDLQPYKLELIKCELCSWT